MKLPPQSRLATGYSRGRRLKDHAIQAPELKRWEVKDLHDETPERPIATKHRAQNKCKNTDAAA